MGMPKYFEESFYVNVVNWDNKDIAIKLFYLKIDENLGLISEMVIEVYI
jgi:hypothetical protein